MDSVQDRMVTSQVLMVAETDTENQTNHIRQKMEIIQNWPIRKIHRVDMEIIRADMDLIEYLKFKEGVNNGKKRTTKIHI